MNNFLAFHPLWKTYDETINITGDVLTTLNGRQVTAYNQGFITIVNPADYQDIFASWHLEPKDCLPFIKFAFGQFIFFHDNSFKVLDPVNNFIEPIGEKDDFDYIMDNFLCDEDTLNEVFLKDMYLEVVDALGAPAPDECYAFVAALALGGSRSKENVQKTKLKEQLMILAKL